MVNGTELQIQGASMVQEVQSTEMLCAVGVELLKWEIKMLNNFF